MTTPTEKSLELAREFRDRWNIRHGSDVIPMHDEAVYDLAALLDTVRLEQEWLLRRVLNYHFPIAGPDSMEFSVIERIDGSLDIPFAKSEWAELERIAGRTGESE